MGPTLLLGSLQNLEFQGVTERTEGNCPAPHPTQSEGASVPQPRGQHFLWPLGPEVLFPGGLSPIPAQVLAGDI